MLPAHVDDKKRRDRHKKHLTGTVCCVVGAIGLMVLVRKTEEDAND